MSLWDAVESESNWLLSLRQLIHFIKHKTPMTTKRHPSSINECFEAAGAVERKSSCELDKLATLVVQENGWYHSLCTKDYCKHDFNCYQGHSWLLRSIESALLRFRLRMSDEECDFWDLSWSKRTNCKRCVVHGVGRFSNAHCYSNVYIPYSYIKPSKWHPVTAGECKW